MPSKPWDGMLNPEEKETLKDRMDIVTDIHEMLTEEDITDDYWVHNGVRIQVARMKDQEVENARRIIPYATAKIDLVRLQDDQELDTGELELVVKNIVRGDYSCLAQLLVKFDIVTGGIPDVKSLPTPAEVSHRCKKLAHLIFINHSSISQFWEQHGNDVKAKWSTMPEQERVKLLRTWDDINETHREDFWSVILHHCPPEKGTWGNLRGRDLKEGSFRWPHISIEDLKTGNNFPAFLESRATALPNLFVVSHDSQSLVLGENFIETGKERLGAYGMSFPQATNYIDYGTIAEDAAINLKFEIQNPKEELDGCGGFLGISAVEGEEILETQVAVYGFLRRMCERFPLSEPVDRNGAQPAQASEHQGHDQNEIDPLIRLFTEHNCTKPGRADTSALLKILKTKHFQAKTDLSWAREDPSFFWGLQNQCKEHNIDRVRQQHRDEESIQLFGTKWMLDISIYDFMQWDELIQRFSKIDQLAKTYEDQLKGFKGIFGELTPRPFITSCIRTMVYLDHFMHRELTLFAQAAAASPAFRDMIRVESSQEHGVQMELRRQGRGAIEDLAEVFIGFLTNDSIEGMKRNYVLFIAEINRQAMSDELSKYFSPYLRKRLSNLMVLGTCWTQMWQYQPIGVTFRRALALSKKRLKDLRKSLEERHKKLQKSLEARKLKPSSPRFDASIETIFNGVVTSENTPGRQNAETKLKVLWDFVKRRLSQQEFPMTESLDHVLNKAIKVTPNWGPAGSGHEARSEPTSIITITESVNDKKRTRDEADLDEGGRTPGGSIKKVKTRGTPDPTRATNSPVEVPTEIVGQVPGAGIPTEFRVDQRDLDTFQMLFFRQNSRRLGGTLAWNDFRRAMANVGFGITRLSGSECRFSPPAHWGVDDITFHSPHPAHSFRYLDARRIGRRLARNYGIDVGRFVLKGG